jgi:pimeloyl-ACP methyl ester carboxylesterase
MFFFL